MEDDDDEVAASARNYNTISSLAALEDLVESTKDEAWFHHYFLRHLERLPKQQQPLRTILEQPQRRRLSQCREEEDPNGDIVEDEESAALATADSISSPRSSSSRGSSLNTTPYSTVTSTASAPAYPSLPPAWLTSPPHVDKRFFDRSLVEIKSHHESNTTLDEKEEIWLKRTDATDKVGRHKGICICTCTCNIAIH